MKRLLALPSLLVASLALAGIRDPGIYNGLFHIDRWGGCTLNSNIYVMYVSSGLKPDLMRYDSQAIRLDATDVVQPMNPGDGLIRQARYLGPAAQPKEHSETLHLRLTATPIFTARVARFQLRYENLGRAALTLDREEMGLTVLTRKPESCSIWFAPTDGPSFALITRQSFGRYPNPISTRKGASCGRSWSWSLDSPPSYPLPLAAGSFIEMVLTLTLEPGEYEFLFGYGGGVHAERPALSNVIEFDVNQAGEPALAGRMRPK